MTSLSTKCLKLFCIGDGRMDSPGQSAQYCTYTFMENPQNTVFSDNGQENDRKKECHP